MQNTPAIVEQTNTVSLPCVVEVVEPPPPPIKVSAEPKQFCTIILDDDEEIGNVENCFINVVSDSIINTSEGNTIKKQENYMENTLSFGENVLDLMLKQILVEQCIQMVGDERRKRVILHCQKNNGGVKALSKQQQYSLSDQVSVFPELDSNHLPLSRTHVVCANCKREIGYSSYAPHLERCLNMRGSRRAASSLSTNSSLSSGRSRNVVDYSEDALFGDEEEEEYKFSDEDETYESTSLDQKPKKQTKSNSTNKRKRRGSYDSEDDEDYEENIEEDEISEEESEPEPEPEYESDKKPKKRTRKTPPKKINKVVEFQIQENSDDDLDLVNLMTSSSEAEEDSESVSSSENLLQYIDSSQSSSSGSPPKD